MALISVGFFLLNLDEYLRLRRGEKRTERKGKESTSPSILGMTPCRSSELAILLPFLALSTFKVMRDKKIDVSNGLVVRKTNHLNCT